MTKPDYFSNFSPKCCSDEYQEKDDEIAIDNLFKPKDPKKDFILD